MARKTKHSVMEEQIIKIENEFSIKNVGEITKRLKKNIGNARAALIKLEKIEQIDLSAIQVVHALQKYAEKKKLELKVETQLSEDVKLLLSHTGFNDFF
jgi:anti-anti-sigma regulatory factor